MAKRRNKNRSETSGRDASGTPVSDVSGPERTSISAGPPRWAWVVAGLATLLAAFLRLRGLGDPGLWTDELVSWWAIAGTGPVEVIRRASGCMATPALSFLLQDASVALLGRSEWALRLPSALAGIATIPLVFLAGWRTFGAAAGTVAAAFLAVHPFHLWWSTDGRPYALAILLATGSIWAFSEMLRSGRTTALVAWVGCTAALLATQFIFLPLPAAQAAAWLILRRTDRAPGLPPRRAAVALGAAAVLSLPVLPHLLRVMGRGASLTWSQPTSDLFPGLYRLLQTNALVAGGLLFLAYAYARARPAGELPGAGSWTRDSGDVLVLVLSLVLPLVVLAGLASLGDLTTMVSKTRYSAAYLAPVALLIGWLTTRPSRVAGRVVFAGGAVVFLAATAVVPVLRAGTPFNRNAGNEDWRAAIELLEAGWQSGDTVVLRSGLIETNALYDGTFPEECAGYVAAPLPGFYGERDLTPLLLPMEFKEGTPPEYAMRFGDALAGQERVWLVMMQPADPATYFQRVDLYIRGASGRPLRPVQGNSFGPVSVALLAAAPGG